MIVTKHPSPPGAPYVSPNPQVAPVSKFAIRSVVFVAVVVELVDEVSVWVGAVVMGLLK
jgi:hypothetical protein